MWNEFTGLLEEIINQYLELLAVCARKKTALIAVRIDELEQALRSEGRIVSNIGRLEKKRRDLACQLAAKYGLPPEHKLADCLDVCGAAVKDRLQSLTVDFATVVDEVAAAVKANDMLARQALNAVNYRLNVLTSATVDTTYRAEGQEQVSTVKAFDFRA